MLHIHTKEGAVLAAAKVFTNRHSQAIRWLKDTETSRKPRLDAVMAAISDKPLPDNFLSDTSSLPHPPLYGGCLHRAQAVL